MSLDPVADAIQEWAAPDPDLGWEGLPQLQDEALADELAAWLRDRGLVP